MTESRADSIEAVTFDLDDTLLDERGSTRAAVDVVCRLLGTGPGEFVQLPEQYMLASDRIWAELGAVPIANAPDQAAAIRLRVWKEALAAIGVNDGQVAREAVAHYAEARRTTYRLFPEALSTLRALRGRVGMVIVTNGIADIQRDKIQQTGLAELIEPAFISGELGVGKPDRRIFELALGSIGAHASRAIHVGDLLSADIAGALGAGMGAVWIDRSQRTGAAPPAGAIRIASLAEVPALVDREPSSAAADGS